MAIDFHALSGSPFSWKVWLALEYLGAPYRLHMLSVDAGDLKSTSFLVLNPRGKVPVLVDDGFVLAESDAILDYLSEKFSRMDRALWPAGLRDRAYARQVVQEATNYIYPAVRKLVTEFISRRDQPQDLAAVDEALRTLAQEFARLEIRLRRPFLGGDSPGGVDFAIYPLLAIFRRVAARSNVSVAVNMVGPATTEWMGRIEALAFFPKTYPPHWKS